MSAANNITFFFTYLLEVSKALLDPIDDFSNGIFILRRWSRWAMIDSHQFLEFFQIDREDTSFTKMSSSKHHF